jgi:hypothetical protein
MATGATGTPTTNYSIPKYATSADAPNGTGFNSAMDAIDLALKGVADAKLGVFGSPTNGQVPVWSTANSRAEWGVGASPSVTPVQLLNPSDSNAFWTVSALAGGASIGHWEFVKDVLGTVYGQVLIPSGVTSATLRLLLGANATSGVTRMQVYANAVANTEAFGGGSWSNGNPLTAQDVTVPGTALVRKDVTFSVSGLVGGDVLVLAIAHDGAHANDTLAVNTLLYGAWLEPA